MNNKLHTALLVVIVLLLVAQFFVDRPGRFQWHPRGGSFALDTKTGQLCDTEPKSLPSATKVHFIPDPNQEPAPKPTFDEELAQALAAATPEPYCVDLR